MPDNEQVRRKEEQFTARFRDNLGVGPGQGALRLDDRLGDLRQATEGKLTRAELEARYPLGKCVSVQLGGEGRLFGKTAERVTLIGKVTLRLERFVERDADDEPLSLPDLHDALSEQADLAGRNRYEAVLGLFSPTGWADEARRFVQNEPPGSGWASSVVHPILIGPEMTELLWDTKDSKVGPYVQYFCGLTMEERRRVCTDDIQKAVVVQDFANLTKIAGTRGFDIEFVKNVARDFCRDTKELKLATVRGVGPVVKRRI